MSKTKTYQEQEESKQIVCEPAVEYKTSFNATTMPGCCTVSELHAILDRVEKDFSEGKGIPHEEALKRIMAW